MLGFRGVSVLGILGVSLSLAYGAEPAFLREERWELGKKYLAAGKAKEAKEVLAELSKSYPEEADIYLFLAIASLRLRDVPGAEIAIRRALSLNPDHVEARTLVGWIDLEVRRDYAGAVGEYSRVVELRPDWPEAHNNLGVARKKRGDLEQAVASFNRALELRGDYSEAWSNRGWVHAEQKKWREAQADFEQALRFNPNDEGALYGLSQALREVRDYAGAQKALSALIARSPNFVYWLEWGEIELVRYYWLFLLAAGLVYLNSRYQRARRRLHGGADGKET